MNKNPKPTTKGANPNNSNEPLRFAHPFYTSVPPEKRAALPNQGTRMLDHIQGTLHPIPPLKRNNGQWSLTEIIGNSGVAGIQVAGKIIIHLTGDTGVPETDHETRQVMVADAMAQDYVVNAPEKSPAFFFHLGDVIYGQSTGAYLDQFYRPYMHYPGKIIAIPGNHDGDVDSKMADFIEYFCAPTPAIPSIANSIFRQTMNQPGVYWCLDAPFVQIVGLYSNSAENPGFISGSTIGSSQKNWLVSTLKTLKTQRDKGTRKALLFATHHPPYSSGGHTGSTDMLNDIWDACTQAKLAPDAFFSGHAHSIQYYTRSLQFNGGNLKIPFVVSGNGGHGDQTVSPDTGKTTGDCTYDFAYQGWGYTKLEIDKDSITISSYGVDWNSTKQIHSVTVPLS